MSLKRLKGNLRFACTDGVEIGQPAARPFSPCGSAGQPTEKSAVERGIDQGRLSAEPSSDRSCRTPADRGCVRTPESRVAFLIP